MTGTNSTDHQHTLNTMSYSPEHTNTLVLETDPPFGPEPQVTRPSKKPNDVQENLEDRKGSDINITGTALEMASYIKPGSTENVETVYHYSHVAIISRPVETDDEDVIVDVEDGEEDSDEDSEEERKRKRRRIEEGYKRDEEQDIEDMRLEDICDYYLE